MPSYILDSGFRLIKVNPHWNRFALENGAPSGVLWPGVQGIDALRLVTPALRPFYKAGYDMARSGLPWHHVYECSSPGHHRVFQMHVVYLPSECEYLVIHAHAPFELLPREACLPSEAYRNGSPGIVMCANCRRTMRPSDGGWDWVPGYLDRPPQGTEYDLCPNCAYYHYGTNQPPVAAVLDGL